MTLSAARLSIFVVLICVPFAAVDAMAASDTAELAKEVVADARISELQLFVENDKWAGTDRNYTNGFKVGVGVKLGLFEDMLKDSSGWMLNLLSDPAANTEFGLFGGQNMYTPRAITVSTPQPFDRPWAAWLYLGGIAQHATDSTLDSVEADVGVVGPAALGRPIQTEWHRLIGVNRPRGWDNQNPTEAAFLVGYLHKHRYGNDNFDFVPHYGVTVGTVMTLARAGGIVRFGQHMTGFGPDGIEPGGAMLQGTRHEQEQGRNFEWYAFVGADYRLVARNIFLDGTVFHDSPSVDRRTGVHDLTRGFSLRYGQLRFSLTRVRRSEEFATPRGGGGGQTFDSFNIGFEFN